jgi:hypothetical protein
MQGFLSRDGMPPADLLAAGCKEIRGYGVDLIEGEVVGLQPGFAVELAGGRTLQARRVLIATGVRDEVPDLPCRLVDPGPAPTSVPSSRGFAGDDRFVVDYLAEERLQRQPADVRRFLLWTSILDRLSGGLRDAVTGLDGGQRTLEDLDRRNLFLIPLDARREWYRYHHLFADVLRTRITRDEPDRVRDLHRRASMWYERSGERHDAIRHALAGEDFEPAWWLKLQARPDTTVELVDGSRAVRAHAAEGEERDRLCARWRELSRDYDAWAAMRTGKTSFVVLEPHATDAVG